MPIHDWTRVDAGIFHHFHQRWIAAITDALNGGLLPQNYYALDEQVTTDLQLDVVTDQLSQAEERYAGKENQVVVHHARGDRIVALVEIVSPGNKASKAMFRKLVAKTVAFLRQGYHLLIVDIQPPTPRDPQGIHGAIWDEIGDSDFQAPEEKPLTLAAYTVDETETTAFVEPVAVGDSLPAMPLFLTPENYVEVPLEAAYAVAWQKVPLRWQRVLNDDAENGK